MKIFNGQYHKILRFYFAFVETIPPGMNFSGLDLNMQTT